MALQRLQKLQGGNRGISEKIYRRQVCALKAERVFYVRYCSVTQFIVTMSELKDKYIEEKL